MDMMITILFKFHQQFPKRDSFNVLDFLAFN